jgi:basic membrane protein A
MMKSIHFLLLLLLLGSCSSNSDSPVEELNLKSVTLITSVSGLGDNGYNDLIFSGVVKFFQENEVKLSMQQPTAYEDVRAKIDHWIAETRHSGVKNLLLLASSDYRELIAGEDLQLTDNQHILAFECAHDGLPQGVSSFLIRRYGASYLAGCLAGESSEAHIVAALEGDPVLPEAIAGFSDGYRSASGGKEVTMHYLSEDYHGYSMPNEAYQLTKTLGNEAFIFPLAGDSNNGVYRYTQENPTTLQLVAGMDIDCSDLSTRIPYSMVILINTALYDLLNKWYSTETIPEHTNYNLASSNAIDVAINQTFRERAQVWLDYYDDADYWQNRYARYKSEAIQKENAFYGQ